MHNFDIICRICVKEAKESVPLFNTTITDQTLLSDFLNQITNLQIVEEDNLPKLLCGECLQRLSDCFRLIQLCSTSDLLLKQQLQSVSKHKESPDLKEECFEINNDTPQEFNNDSELNFPDKDTETNCKSFDRYNCNICSVTFTNKNKLKRHQNVHNADGPHKCEICLQRFPKKINLNVHMRSHATDEEKKFTCKTCGKQYIYKYLLKQHEFKHTDKKPFPCSECNRGCLTAESLRRHMKVHAEDYAKKKHACKVCSKEFDYPSFLAEHMKNHTGERPHLCSVCGKGFRQTGALHYHQRIHTGLKPFTCTICNGQFMTQGILKVHMRKHTNERPYVCHVCGLGFRQSTDLKVHQRTHSGDKPVLCPICGKRMSTTGQLTIHLRSHTGEKPFQCEKCAKAFTTKSMLSKHQRIHTGERPYVCDMCGKAFNQSSSLKTHRKTHQTGIKKQKRNPKQKECVAIKVCAVDENMLEVAKENDCLVYKNNMESLHAEIVTEQFINDAGQDINIVKVILPAPIPLLHNL